MSLLNSFRELGGCLANRPLRSPVLITTYSPQAFGMGDIPIAVTCTQFTAHSSCGKWHLQAAHWPEGTGQRPVVKSLGDVDRRGQAVIRLRELVLLEQQNGAKILPGAKAPSDKELNLGSNWLYDLTVPRMYGYHLR